MMPCYQYKQSRCGNKTKLRLAYLQKGISYIDKIKSVYRIRSLVAGATPLVLLGIQNKEEAGEWNS